MGPFSNNTPVLPSAPNNGSKLPVPDVEGTPPPVITAPDAPDNSTKKWLITTLIIAGGMALTGVIVFFVYLFVSNTPTFMLGAAMHNLMASQAEAGDFTSVTTQNHAPFTLKGDFLSYADPSNQHVNVLTVGVGHDASRVNATMRIFPDANYFQIAGLGNLKRLLSSGSQLTDDQLARLSALDGQWYSQTSDDTGGQHIIQGAFTTADTETIEQQYLKNQFIIPGQQFPDEKINGLSSMHLQLGINQAKFAAFLQAVKAANLKSVHLSDDDLKTIATVQWPHDLTAEVWIARTDRAFQQIRIASGSDSFAVLLHSELAAAQQQAIDRPSGAQSLSSLLRAAGDIIGGK